MDEPPGAGVPRRLCDAPRPIDMNGGKRLRTLRRQNADRIDNGVGTVDRPREQRRDTLTVDYGGGSPVPAAGAGLQRGV